MEHADAGAAEIRLARAFQALGDETRLRILERLRDGERCECDLEEALELGGAHLAAHIDALRAAGLVTVRAGGCRAHYALATGAVAELEAFLHALGELLGPDAQLARCAG